MNSEPQKQTKYRYVAVTSYYVYADSAKEAAAIASLKAMKEATSEDNQCRVDELYEMPFGSLIKGENILRNKSLTKV